MHRETPTEFPIAIKAVSSEALAELPFHPSKNLENLSVGYSRRHISYLVDQGDNSQIVRVDESILDHNEDIFDTLVNEDYYYLEEIESYRRCFDAMPINHYGQMNHAQGLRGVTICSLPDSGSIALDSGYIPVPSLRNSLFKITPFGFMQAYLVGLDTYIMAIPAPPLRIRRISELPGTHLICPNDYEKLRCCVTCEHSEGEAVCKFKLIGLQCCRLSSRLIDVVMNSVKTFDSENAA